MLTDLVCSLRAIESVFGVWAVHAPPFIGFLNVVKLLKGRSESERLPRAGGEWKGGGGFGPCTLEAEAKAARSRLDMYLPGIGASLGRFGVGLGRYIYMGFEIGFGFGKSNLALLTGGAELRWSGRSPLPSSSEAVE